MRWIVTWLERFWQDLTYGCRMLAKSPGFTLVAVISLALGIGANCAVFSWADALLLRPLSVPRPGEVLTVGSTASIEGFTNLVSSYRDYIDIRDRNQSFEGLAAFSDTTVGFAINPQDTPKLTLGMVVSGNFFKVLGVEPALGRSLRAEEDQVPGRDAVVVLGHEFWSRQFGADRSILGRKVRLSAIEFTVVGVAPEGFSGLSQFVRSDFFVPVMMWPRLMNDPKARPLEQRDFRDMRLKGRLKPGVTMARAQTELTAIGKELERAYPDTNHNRSLAVRTELQARIEQDRVDATLIAMLTMLSASVLFVACANVAGLLTSRAPMRAREIALRLAVGAGRLRVIRQLITESVLVAMLGGVLGLGIGYAAVSVFQQIQLPTDLPIALTFELNRRAFMFSMAVAFVSAILFGLTPAIRSARTDLTAVMKATDAAGYGKRRRWGRGLLVGSQVAVSVVLLAIALFMYRGFQRQLGTGPGYRLDHLLMMSFDPSLVRYTRAQSQQFFDQLAERVKRLPGVKNVTMTSSVPMATDGQSAATIVPEGFQFPAGKDNVTLLSANVDEHFFETMGLTIVRGRGIQATDTADTPKVAIVNEQLAQHYWPTQDALGKRFRLIDSQPVWVEVVGVAKTSKYIFLAEPPMEFAYFPYKQRPQIRMTLLTQTEGEPASFAAPVRDAVRGLDSNMPMFNVRTMEEFYQMRVVSVFKVVIGTVGAMGVMGLALSIVGLYGLVAHAVTRRTREIGIRMAIGADRLSVLRMVLGQGMLLASAGLLVGLIASFGAGRALVAAFPGGPGDRRGPDVVPYLMVAVAVVTATLVAAYLPARRASRINPTEALRYE